MVSRPTGVTQGLIDRQNTSRESQAELDVFLGDRKAGLARLLVGQKQMFPREGSRQHKVRPASGPPTHTLAQTHTHT